MGEKKYFDFDVELKASEEERGVIEGYASTFGNIDRHGDIIAKEAFKGGRTKVPIFGMHNPREGIGVGVVTEDEKGLYIKMKLAVDNQDSDILRDRAREYYAMSKEGIIEKMSIGFITQEADYEQRKIQGKDRTIRVIKKVDLMEVSLVPIPANDKARVTTVKALGEDEEFKAELKEMVKEAVRENFTEMKKEMTDEIKSEIEKTEQKKRKSSSFQMDYLIQKKMGLF